MIEVGLTLSLAVGLLGSQDTSIRVSFSRFCIQIKLGWDNSVLLV